MMAEELPPGQMAIEQEEGEILEDGEIADDADDIVAIGDLSPIQATVTKDEKENKESNMSKFGSFSSYYPMERDDHFKPHNKRKKKNIAKKRKRANSIDSKRKPPIDSLANATVVDISHCINDPTYDAVEVADEHDYNFDLLPFDVLLEILGCSVAKELLDNVSPGDRRNTMLRIMKIIKQIHGNDPDTARRFARLKRRSQERKNSNSIPGPGPGPKPVYKAICKFYLEGKCHKGPDCYFSHDCVVPKRKELCKFYLQGFCGKGDDCLFMHGEFPCKFFHTNTECYSGEKCRFSHAPLNEDTREILRNYLDSGTLPDDPKPYRPPHISDWSNNNKNFETVDPDSMEFDTSFNFETEELLSKPRPVILGEPTHRMKASHETWKWQQELKELEKAYTGLKKNLFCIDEVFAIGEKPPTPRIEDDEDEVEAQIMNYYHDTLDTDEMDELLALQEIEEHEKKVKEEEALLAKTGNLPESSIPVSTNELSEEEKRLIEASAHDEDLRIIPGQITVNQIFDQANFNPGNPFYSANDSYTQPSGIFTDASTTNVPSENKAEANFSEPSVPFVSTPEITATDVNNLVRQIRNGVAEPAISAGPTVPVVKPEYRDPRLNRMKDPNRLAGTSPNQTFQSPVQSEDRLVQKPFIKVCNPNVIIDYRLILMKVSVINYSCYLELYQSDNAVKNDPRLKKFFSLSSNMNADQKVAAISEIGFGFPKMKSDIEPLPTLPSLNVPSILSPPVPNKILAPLEVTTSNVKTVSESSSSPSRDPRIRSKDSERRRNSESKMNDGGSPTLLLSTVTTPSNDAIKTEDSPKSEQNLKSEVKAGLENGSSDLSSIPSYAIPALPSIFSSINNNLLASLNSDDKLSGNTSSSSDSYPKSIENNEPIRDSPLSKDSSDLEEDDEEEQNSLKIDMDADKCNSEPEPLLSNLIGNANSWQPSNVGNQMDSDNDEMEIDLQHQESEVDSENENELIIASLPETEDNKDFESLNSEAVAATDIASNS